MTRMKCRASSPPDGGWGWMCVIGKLISYFCVLGTTSAFGVIYVDVIDYFNTTREKAAWIGSLSHGLTCLSGPLSSAMTSRFGIQKTTAAGTLLAFTGCFICWFANGIPYLYVSYGVMMGIGLGVIYVPSMLIVVQYFDKRLGIANAIGSIGNGLGTVVLPPLYAYLLQEFGWRGTLLLLSGILLHGFICAVIFIPPSYLMLRKASSTKNAIGPNTMKSFSSFISCMKIPSFVLYILATAIGCLGYNIPFVHVPDLAVLFGIDKYDATYLITIMGIANIVGRILFGWISDFKCVSVIVLQGLSMLVCGVVTAVCPHLTGFYALAMYCVIHGAFIGVFASLMAVVPVALVGADRAGDALGMMLFLVGITLSTSSPLAGWLFDITKNYNASFYVASCSFLLSGLMTMVVMSLHKRQFRQKGVEDTKTVQSKSKSRMDTVQTVSQSYMDIVQTLS